MNKPFTKISTIFSKEQEIWKDISGYEGIYQVSNFGRVKSLERHNVNSVRQLRIVKEKYLKVFYNLFDYRIVSLYCKSKGAKTHTIHRLVAEAFIPNPENKAQINHINGIRNDNRIENLEWVTPSENTKHSYDYLRRNLKSRIDLSLDSKQINSVIEGEVWESVVGYVGIYEVSNFGRVKSVNRPNEIFLKIILEKGYQKVSLNKNGKKFKASVHRLIAQSFIPNPENKPQVNHINGIRNDNRIENLEWCTRSENIKHSYDILKRKSNGGFKKESCKKVAQYDLYGNLITVFDSVKCVERKLGIKCKDVSACALGTSQKDQNGKMYIRKKAKGFMFKYYNSEPLLNIEPYTESVNLRRSKPIKVYDLNKNIISEFTSSKEASVKLKLNETCIRRVLEGTQHQHKGYTFKLK